MKNDTELYNVFYLDDTYGDPPKYEGTTNNPKKWLEKHNKNRVAEGNENEPLHWFDFQEVHLELF